MFVGEGASNESEVVENGDCFFRSLYLANLYVQATIIILCSPLVAPQ